jgi:hypothetical protein
LTVGDAVVTVLDLISKWRERRLLWANQVRYVEAIEKFQVLPGELDETP